jgi:hypothetical protein
MPARDGAGVPGGAGIALRLSEQSDKNCIQRDAGHSHTPSRSLCCASRSKGCRGHGLPDGDADEGAARCDSAGDLSELGASRYEVRRWLWLLFGLSRVSQKSLAAGTLELRDRQVVHLIGTPFPDSWPANPLWISLSWTTRTFPNLKVARLAVDEDDERVWVNSHLQTANRVVDSESTEWHEWLEFTGERTRKFVGTFRAKRFVH